MSGYLAKVRVLAMVGGVRKEFAPGTPLPELDPRDIQALEGMKAIECDRGSSRRDAAPPAGGAGAAGGANAGTNTTTAGEGSGSGALASEPATGLPEQTDEPGAPLPEIDAAGYAADATPLDVAPAEPKPSAAKPKPAPRARSKKE